jgi:hypothetical protein
MNNLVKSQQLNVFKTQLPSTTFNDAINREPTYLYMPPDVMGYGQDEPGVLASQSLIPTIENKPDWISMRKYANALPPLEISQDITSNSRDHIDDLIMASYTGLYEGKEIPATNQMDLDNAKEIEKMFKFIPIVF